MQTFFAGELLMRLECEALNCFEQADHFKVRYTGAEANAAIAMAKLGAKNVFLISAVPDNPLGRACLGEICKHGVHTNLVLRGPATGRLGLFFLETGYGMRPSKVVYDRRDSVFSQMPASAYDFKKIFQNQEKSWLHISGTLPALSENCLDLTMKIINAAKSFGITVSFDLNYRAALWSKSEAEKIFKIITTQCDVLIANAGVAEDFLDTPENELCSAFDLQYAALSRRIETDASSGSFGASLYCLDGSAYHAPVRSFPVLDRVGGGDAFAGGMIFALQQDWEDSYRINFAAACGVLKHFYRGDFTFANQEDVSAVINNKDLNIRR